MSIVRTKDHIGDVYKATGPTKITYWPEKSEDKSEAKKTKLSRKRKIYTVTSR